MLTLSSHPHFFAWQDSALYSLYMELAQVRQLTLASAPAAALANMPSPDEEWKPRRPKVISQQAEIFLEQMKRRTGLVQESAIGAAVPEMA